MIRILSTSEESFVQGVKVCLYGRSGSGKTFLSRTAPNPIIISAEAGTLSLRKITLPMIKIKTVQDLTAVHEWAQKSAEARQFKTLYIDSFSEIAEIVLAHARPQVKDARQAYFEMQEKSIATLKAFRDLPGFHVVMVFKEEPVKDESTGIITYMPSVPGSKLAPQLPYLFDEVFRLAVGKDAKGVDFRYLQTQPERQYEAKDRSGCLSNPEVPDLSIVFQKILS